MSSTTRRLSVVVTAAIVTTVLSACGSGGGNNPDNIAFGVYQSSTLSMPAHIGVDEGIFEKHGLTVELIDGKSGPELLSGLIGGTTQVALAGAAPVVVAGIQQGQKLAGLPPYGLLDYTVAVREGSGITDLKGLEGKKIAVPARGGAVEIYIRELFREQGLDIGSVEFVAAGPTANQVPLMRKGDVDAVVMSYAAIETFAKAGIPLDLVVDIREGTGGELGSYGLGAVYASSQKFVDDNPATMEKICAAMTEIQQWIADPANQDAGAAVLGKVMAFDDETAKRVWKDEAPTWQASIDSAQWDKNVAWTTNNISNSPNVEADLPSACS